VAKPPRHPLRHWQSKLYPDGNGVTGLHIWTGRAGCCCNVAVPAKQKRQATKIFQQGFRSSNLLPVMSAEECCLSAHAELRFGGSSILHRSASSSSRKTRARGFRRHPSGRNSRRGRFRSINAAGLRACSYKTAPGRSNWPNRDPIGELGGFNLYGFVRNNPVGRYDPHGLLDAGPGIGTIIRISLIIGGTGAGSTIGGGLAVGGGALLCVGAVCFISSVPFSPVLYPSSGARNAPPTLVRVDPGSAPLPLPPTAMRPGQLPFPDPQEWIGPINSFWRRYREAEEDCERRLEKYAGHCKKPLIQQERDDFMKQCMRDHGFDYPPNR
jgi:RHS repeat-associated protein